MRFVTIGLIGTPDSEALARREAALADHRAFSKVLFEAGVLKYSGPLFGDDGTTPAGSIMVVEYPTEEAYRAEFLAKEPFATEGVWRTVNVHQHKCAPYFE